MAYTPIDWAENLEVDAVKLDKMDSQIDANENNISNHENRITTNENNISNHENRITTNENDINNIENGQTLNILLQNANIGTKKTQTAPWGKTPTFNGSAGLYYVSFNDIPGLHLSLEGSKIIGQDGLVLIPKNVNVRLVNDVTNSEAAITYRRITFSN